MFHTHPCGRKYRKAPQLRPWYEYTGLSFRIQGIKFPKLGGGAGRGVGKAAMRERGPVKSDQWGEKMRAQHLLTIAGLALTASAQSYERRADITGGGDRNQGKCTIEVVVDGSAEVEIRGDHALLRNLAGQPPSWRRFVCNMPMPLNPIGFRFAGVDGRGRQALVRAPEHGDPAVIRIDDPPSGAEGYTFDVFWQSGPPMQAASGPPDRRDDDGDRFYHDRDDFYRGRDWRARLFARVRQDLDFVSRYSFRGDDRYRLDRVYRELDDLQRDYASGRWDRRALDDVVQSLDRVVDDNRLTPRDRDMLRDDQSRLRELRDRR